MGPAELWTIISKSLRCVAANCRYGPQRTENCNYSIWHVVRIFLFCLLYDRSPRHFFDRLQTKRGLRRRCGLPNRLISRSQFYKRVNTREFGEALFGLLRYSAAKALRALGEQEVRIVAMDLTRVESDYRRDRRGRRGYDSQGGFFGYKLGLIISKQGVVLGISLMKANGNEFWAQGRLLRLARATLQTTFGRMPVEYLVCDSGFDGEPVYRNAHQQLQAAVLCPPRCKFAPGQQPSRTTVWYRRVRVPHRTRNQALWENPDAKDIYLHRMEIERVIGQLKNNPIRIDEVPPRRRGVTRLLPLCLGKVILYNFALNENAANALPIRNIRFLLA